MKINIFSHGSKFIFVLLCAVALLGGCEKKGQTLVASTTPKDAGGFERVTNADLPVVEYEDISSCFTESAEPLCSEEEKKSVICDHLTGKEFACSENRITISMETPQKLAIHCTWDPASRKVYIGLKGEDNTYLSKFSHGHAAGFFDLREIPDGDYEVVMFSDDNPSMLSVMLFQILPAD